MTVSDQHRALATEILVRRSIGGWGLEADCAAVARERLLWAKMSESDQVIEDAWLSSIWGRRGMERHLVDAASGNLVKILDSAFGLAAWGYRPWVKGPYGEGSIWKWLWVRGYQVIDYDAKYRIGGAMGKAVMVIPAHRVVQESDRLVGAMVKAGVGSIGSWGSDGDVQARSLYDPAQGVATLELVGVGVLSLVV